MSKQTLDMSPFQSRVLDIPEPWNIVLMGGRGGGKSYALALLALRHLAQYGAKARVLFLRATHPGLEDFALICRELFGKVYGSGARYNSTTGIWRIPGGGYMELNQLEASASGMASYAQTYQGRSFSLLMVDEAGAYPSDALLNMLRSNLRANKAVPTRLVFAANPGGPGHSWLYRKFILRGRPWVEYKDDGDSWVLCPSTLIDNPYLDAEDYLRQLNSACVGDTDLLRAWVNGDWDIARGAYFGGCLDEKRVKIPAWSLPLRLSTNAVPTGQTGVYLAESDLEPWRFFVSVDWGSAAPAVCYLCAKSPGATAPDGRWYSRGSVLLLDEYTTAIPSQPDKGNGATVPVVAERIKSMCREWGVPVRGVGDDAMWANTGSGHSVSIGDELADCGVYLRPARKGSRIAGWEVMRRMLADAGRPDVPAMYVSERCRFWWDTVPVLPRSLRHPEDVDTNANDHCADASRYALGMMFNPRPVSDIAM